MDRINKSHQYAALMTDFPISFKFTHEYSVCLEFNYEDPIGSQFCTCQDSRAVVACAKLCPDLMIIFHRRATHIFTRILSQAPQLLVSWSNDYFPCKNNTHMYLTRHSSFIMMNKWKNGWWGWMNEWMNEHLSQAHKFLFRLQRVTKSVTYWHCPSRDKTHSCPAAIIQDGKGFHRHTAPHDHDVHPENSIICRISSQAKNEAILPENSGKSASVILKDVLMKFPDEVVQSPLFKRNNLERMINRERQSYRDRTSTAPRQRLRLTDSDTEVRRGNLLSIDFFFVQTG